LYRFFNKSLLNVSASEPRQNKRPPKNPIYPFYPNRLPSFTIFTSGNRFIGTSSENDLLKMTLKKNEKISIINLFSKK